MRNVLHRIGLAVATMLVTLGVMAVTSPSPASAADRTCPDPYSYVMYQDMYQYQYVTASFVTGEAYSDGSFVCHYDATQWRVTMFPGSPPTTYYRPCSLNVYWQSVASPAPYRYEWVHCDPWTLL